MSSIIADSSYSEVDERGSLAIESPLLLVGEPHMSSIMFGCLLFEERKNGTLLGESFGPKIQTENLKFLIPATTDRAVKFTFWKQNYTLRCLLIFITCLEYNEYKINTLNIGILMRVPVRYLFPQTAASQVLYC